MLGGARAQRPPAPVPCPGTDNGTGSRPGLFAQAREGRVEVHCAERWALLDVFTEVMIVKRLNLKTTSCFNYYVN